MKSASEFEGSEVTPEAPVDANHAMALAWLIDELGDGRTYGGLPTHVDVVVSGDEFLDTLLIRRGGRDAGPAYALTLRPVKLKQRTRAKATK